jgi:hypothetical protein
MMGFQTGYNIAKFLPTGQLPKHHSIEIICGLGRKKAIRALFRQI